MKNFPILIFNVMFLYSFFASFFCGPESAFRRETRISLLFGLSQVSCNISLKVWWGYKFRHKNLSNFPYETFFIQYLWREILINYTSNCNVINLVYWMSPWFNHSQITSGITIYSGNVLKDVDVIFNHLLEYVVSNVA